MGFRPLDGESFSKHYASSKQRRRNASFRPLDGESFSKLENQRRLVKLYYVSVP